MKSLLLPVLVATLFPSTWAQTSGIDFLPFVELDSSASRVPTVDDGSTGAILTLSGGISFDGSFRTVVYVGTNGVISFNARVTSTSASAPFSSSSSPNYVVAPFWGDVDIRNSGFIEFETFYSFNGSSELNQVSNFIEAQNNVFFFGTWMIVVTWNAVPHFSVSGTNTFQAIVISNGATTYAVFTYRCGFMGWSQSATIGFKGDDNFRNHPLSRSSNANDIACDGVTEWNNVVYELSSGSTCFSFQFGCSNGLCIDSDEECDGNDDCGDNSDEQSCSTVDPFDDSTDTNVGAIVGAVIAVTVFFIALPIIICVIVFCCVSGGVCVAASRRPRTHVVTSTTPAVAPTTATVLATTTTEQASTVAAPKAPTAYPPQEMAAYPPQPYPQHPPAPYPQQPPAPYPQHPPVSYPQQPPASYSQQPSAPYPQQPTGYPDEPPPYPGQPEGYPPQQPDFQGYPPPSGYPPY